MGMLPNPAPVPSTHGGDIAGCRELPPWKAAPDRRPSAAGDSESTELDGASAATADNADAGPTSAAAEGGDLTSGNPEATAESANQERMPKPKPEGPPRRPEMEMDRKLEKMDRKPDSQSLFAERVNTMLILDWDDTIFPTTWVKQDCRLNWRLPVATQMEPGPRMSLVLRLLETLADRAVELLSDAAAVANILIITLAKRPWVEQSMNNFMPRLRSVMNTHQFKVIYAQECLDSKETAKWAADPARTPEELNDLWTRVKRDVITRELHELHEQHKVSWKNVISFGDSDFERNGTITASEEYMRQQTEGGELQSLGATAEGVSADGSLKRLRTKTVKLLDHPTVEELTAELTVLRRWLPYMVRHDSGFDLELNAADDNSRLREWDLFFTGEDSGLSWQRLAGMEEGQAAADELPVLGSGSGPD